MLPVQKPINAMLTHRNRALRIDAKLVESRIVLLDRLVTENALHTSGKAASTFMSL